MAGGVGKTPGVFSSIILPGDSEAQIKKKVEAQKTSRPFAQSTTPTDAQLKALGIDPTQKVGPANIGSSQIVDVLGGGRMVKFDAVNAPGKVAWVNFDLARKMGFDVPPGNVMTPEFEAQLMEALSWRALKPGEAPEGSTIEMYADKYGGSGIGTNRGAGRAGFLPWGNLNIKGVGQTPLVNVDPNDFLHSHGGAPMREGLVEAVWGEVNTNLFTQGSTQILAVIDNGDYTVFPDGSKERRALIIRAGSQFRPAHLLEGHKHHKKTADVFVRATEQSGHLVNHQVKGQTFPDMQATMRNIIDAHAKTAAEQVRWRILHGALSTSNMELDGAQLDLATQTSQERTASVYAIPHGGTFGKEHNERGEELKNMYAAVRDSLGKSQKAKMRAKAIKVDDELGHRYEHHLGVEMLKAAGLKQTVAESMMDSDPKLVGAFRDTLRKLSELTNEKGRFSIDKQTQTDKSVVDVFNVLRNLPAVYFAHPEAPLVDEVKELLNPLIKASPSGAKSLSDQVSKLGGELATTYKQVMDLATKLGTSEYDDSAAMARSITNRAQFENAPLDRLYKSELHWMLIQAINAYQAHGDVAVFKEAVDKTISASLRNVDALIGQGNAVQMPDGAIELGKRSIDGIDYSVRGWDSGKRRLHLSIPVQKDGSQFVLSTLPGQPKLRPDQVEQLSYRFTTEGWTSTQEVEAKISEDGTNLEFDIPALRSDVGTLEGVFHCSADGGFWLKDGASNFRGYTFAVPDNQELEELKMALN